MFKVVLILLGVIMATQILYYGNKVLAQEHRGEALAFMQKLENMKSLGKLDQIWSPVHTLKDGTTIRLQSIYDTQTIRITSPFEGKEIAKEEIMEAEFKEVVSAKEMLFASVSIKDNPGTDYNHGIHKVERLSPATGGVIWSANHSVTAYNTTWTYLPSVTANEHIVFSGAPSYADHTGTYVIDARTAGSGTLLWSKNVTASLYGDTLIKCSASKLLHAYTGNATLYDTKGNLLWTTPLTNITGDIRPQSAAFGNGLIYISGTPNLGGPYTWFVIALNQDTGAEVWRRDVTHVVGIDHGANGIAYTNGVLAVNGVGLLVDGVTAWYRIELLNSNTGAVIYYEDETHIRYSNWWVIKPSALRGKFFTGVIGVANEERIYSLNDTGGTIWSNNITDGSIYGYVSSVGNSKMFVGGWSYVGGYTRSTIKGLSKTDGSVVWTYTRPENYSMCWSISSVVTR